MGSGGGGLRNNTWILQRGRSMGRGGRWASGHHVHSGSFGKQAEGQGGLEKPRLLHSTIGSREGGGRTKDWTAGGGPTGALKSSNGGQKQQAQGDSESEAAGKA